MYSASQQQQQKKTGKLKTFLHKHKHRHASKHRPETPPAPPLHASYSTTTTVTSVPNHYDDYAISYGRDNGNVNHNNHRNNNADSHNNSYPPSSPDFINSSFSSDYERYMRTRKMNMQRIHELEASKRRNNTFATSPTITRPNPTPNNSYNPYNSPSYPSNSLYTNSSNSLNRSQSNSVSPLEQEILQLAESGSPLPFSYPAPVPRSPATYYSTPSYVSLLTTHTCVCCVVAVCSCIYRDFLLPVVVAVVGCRVSVLVVGCSLCG